MARLPGPFTAFWLSLEIPPDFKTQKNWDVLHKIALKSFNAGRKVEREIQLARRKP